MRQTADGRGACVVSVPGISCGACIGTIERALAGCEGVVAARVNLTQRRVLVTLESPESDPLPALERIRTAGYAAEVTESEIPSDGGDTHSAARLLRCLAVAGFGAANIMLLSVSVWSGAEGAARDTFHLISALIALPVVAYAGRPFFASALSALKAGRLNMDVPISLAVLLATGLSVFETIRGGEHVFFDAAVVLLFFLLIGRYLDLLMRARARSAVVGLARLAAKGAMGETADGAVAYVELDAIQPGMVLRISPGERIPVDGLVLDGTTDLDRSLVTGEHAPAHAGPGTPLEAGILNLTGPIRMRAVRPATESFLAEVSRMLEAAERGRGDYVRIADRAARLYAPLVHLLAALTFAGWVVATGNWYGSLFVAISVLIITCPCALGLAVPVVHVVAAGRLFREGIMMKDGSGLERLATIDRVVFDKTGTLTTGAPRLAGGGPETAEDRAIARALAAESLHPLSRAIAASVDAPPVRLTNVREVPGCGIQALADGRAARLGRPTWVAEIADGAAPAADGPAFARAGGAMSSFRISETLRPNASRVVEAFRDRGIPAELLSGDGSQAVASIAQRITFDEVRHGATPAEKVAHLEDLRRAGLRVLMVGDGLNDAAALAAAHVSMAPGSASDAGRLAADFVFTRENLDAVIVAHRIALRSARLVMQNFGLAAIYNAIAIPLAVAGFVTPLVAAVAMSGSSILVVGNALRFEGFGTGARRAAPQAKESYA
ncbi:heavy metal translocating P-type ATPase [Roseitranquillus sediminis]|uniref:heavy metal translocating P-type ATPase n=1 Tax=Roseitranquillus sediminis TaxID=2809051 RepID=UPI001D0C1D99|nr:heavy metal translocating P-type ATPase [Roseitranquillus sediminis]MBM9594588.1 cadmium-translocating P-type ATPase [Roseitranquillus sediminis]